MSEKFSLDDAISVREGVIKDESIKEHVRAIVKIALSYIPHEKLQSERESTLIAKLISDTIDCRLSLDLMHEAVVEQFKIKNKKEDSD